jgi:hypothetical protein
MCSLPFFGDTVEWLPFFRDSVEYFRVFESHLALLCSFHFSFTNESTEGGKAGVEVRRRCVSIPYRKGRNQMRMSGETMKLHGIVFATAKQLGEHATVETIAVVSGYSEQQVRKALESMHRERIITLTSDRVTALHGFHGERA